MGRKPKTYDAMFHFDTILVTHFRAKGHGDPGEGFEPPDTDVQREITNLKVLGHDDPLMVFHPGDDDFDHLVRILKLQEGTEDRSIGT